MFKFHRPATKKKAAAARKFGAAFQVGLLAALLVLTCGLFQASQPHQASAAPSTYVSNQVVFVLNSSKDLATVAKTYGFTRTKALKMTNSYLGYLPTTADAKTVATKMTADTKIKLVDPDLRMSFVEKNGSTFAFDGSSFAFDNTTGTYLSTPTALTTAANQWAWQTTNLAAMQSLNQGAGVTVAVLDTGVNPNHPDLKGHVLTGWSPIDLGTGGDVNGHGTFVAGIIAQAAPQAKILPVRVLDASGNGTLSDLVDGAYWAANNGAKIINFSLSTYTSSNTLNQLISDLSARDILVVASSGNDNTNNQTYPASNSNVIAVSSSDQQDFKASFSNYGGYVDITGPGVSIYSMYYTGGYAWADGTSFSAPMVAAGAAVYRSLYPGSSAATVKTKLLAAIDPFPAGCSTCNQIGKGRLDFSLIR